ncbi:hypothetical protein CA265_20650 [Sphingobacteriaceae bacterium GW460-11-11-14-LB5]|nr:hypothetical protein CA265_20650 [Sphingobacteriaceae bacterium GW460-11-11-14-LB5]
MVLSLDKIYFFKVEELQNRKIAELNLSEPLKAVLMNNGYQNLKQLLELSPEEIMNIPGLNLKHLSEYKKFLIENNLQSSQKDF